MDKWDKIKKKDLKSLGEAPVEASENIQAPELAPRDNRFTGRTKRIAFTCRPEFYEELRKMAFEKHCYQIEILEKALVVYKKSLLSSETKNGSFVEYEKQRKKQNQPRPSKEPMNKISQKSKEAKKTTQKLNQFWKVNFICDKCQREFEKSIVYSLAPNLDQLNQYPTYCAGCGESKPEFCSFWTETNPEPCSHFIFDKKKQLCRSHNKQVWKKFHEFTKKMSVSGTASWYEMWDQSGDWRYFWNLTKEKNK